MKLEICPKCNGQVSNIYIKKVGVYEILENLFYCLDCGALLKPSYEELK